MLHPRSLSLALALLSGCSCSEVEADTDPPAVPTDTGPSDTDTDAEVIREMLAEDAAIAIIRGDDAWHRTAATAFGDLTGNGHTDALVYAGGHGYGESYVIPGPLIGDISVSRSIATIPWGGLGAFVVDVDGDGQDDIAIVHDGGGVGREFQVHLGPISAATPSTQPDMVLKPSTTFSMGYACDANLDGAVDLVMHHDSLGPQFYKVALGPLTEANMGEEAFDLVIEGSREVRPSRTLLCGYDLTGTGGGDLLFNTDHIDKTVWLIRDPDWSGTQDVLDIGDPTVLRNSNSALAVPGDVTGDGYLDLYNGSSADVGALMAGPLSGDSEVYATFDWRSESHSVASVGDLDGDGVDDLVIGVGSYPRNGGGGAVLLMYGPIAPGGYEVDDVDLVMTTGAERGFFGHKMPAHPEPGVWAAAANAADGPYTASGHTYLFSGWPRP